MLIKVKATLAVAVLKTAQIVHTIISFIRDRVHTAHTT